MRKRIFKRVILYSALVVILCAIIIEVYITGVFRNKYIEDLKQTLSTQAWFIGESIHVEKPHCKKFKEKINARIIVFKESGEIICHTEYDPVEGKILFGNPDVQLATLSGLGTHIVRDDNPYLNLTLMTQDNGEKIFIRLSRSLKEIDQAIMKLRIEINLVVISIIIASGLFIIWQMNRVRKFFTQVSDFADSIAHGFFDRRLFLKDAGEFSVLAENLNKMASDLGNYVNTHLEESSRLNTIIRNIPDALLIINPEGIITASNRAARELFGKTGLEGRHFVEVVRSSDFVRIFESVKKDRTVSGDEITVGENNSITLSVKVSPVFYKAGDVSGFVALFHDITERKKMEEMRKDFIANLTHEIRTPVTAIKGFAETLLSGAMDERENAVRFLNKIKSHSERLTRLVDDLMTISNFELGLTRLNLSQCDIREVIGSVRETFLSRAEEQGLSLREEIKGENTMLRADPDRLHQILINLVENAIKFTDEGEVIIGLDHDEKGRYIFVRDTGIGIPEKYIPRLGERFFRVDPSRSRELGGTGLGLAIVKHLVKAHGWRMEIKSRPSHGTEVKIYIP